jgi:predicted metalloprotease
MRWQGGRRSRNIEDRRGMRLSRKTAGGGIGVLVLTLIALYFGVDPGLFLNRGTQTDISVPTRVGPYDPSPASENLSDFVSVVLADTEDVWHDLFQRMGRTYEEPTLVLFSGAVQSACGFAQSAIGPFYCPDDHKVYIDLDFYRDLKELYNAPGDFAQAYVIAHEIGHHVQTLLGISKKVHAMRSRVNEIQANKLSVMQELQADCLAGAWAYHAHKSRRILERGDVEEALNAASSIGDDRLQKQTRGFVTPDSFTHGSSSQRVRWFRRGLETGDIAQCNTFTAETL